MFHLKFQRPLARPGTRQSNMPELPEVETVVRTLEYLIQGRRIDRIQINYDPIVMQNPKVFQSRLLNQHFNLFKRRGKYILFEMDDCTLVSHLRMEGKFYLKKAQDEWDKHTHVQFYLDDGSRLDYHDTRKFGRMEIIDKKADYSDFKGLGPEPFWDSFNEEYILSNTRNKNTALKALLLDQHFVAGVGNIYADEICFQMGLHPLFKVKNLTGPKRRKLIEVTRFVLNKAIQAGGSTVRSYTSSLGVSGLFQLQIEVYGRANEPCTRCGTPLKRIMVQQRGTCFCPVCQRKR